MAPSSSKSKRPVQGSDNFLEALRDLGKGVVTEVKTQAKKIVVEDVPASIGLGSSHGTLNPNESVSLNQLKKAEAKGEENAEKRFNSQLEQVRQQERSRLMREEANTKQQITSIRAEILNLAKSMGDFAQEVQVAAIQAPVNPGIYHRNFFTHLKSMLVLLRQRVESSKNWLATTNSRAKKQGHYWGQVKKSGTKFMLSSERYMVTSTG